MSAKKSLAELIRSNTFDFSRHWKRLADLNEPDAQHPDVIRLRRQYASKIKQKSAKGRVRAVNSMHRPGPKPRAKLQQQKKIAHPTQPASYLPAAPTAAPTATVAPITPDQKERVEYLDRRLNFGNTDADPLQLVRQIRTINPYWYNVPLLSDEEALRLQVLLDPLNTIEDPVFNTLISPVPVPFAEIEAEITALRAKGSPPAPAPVRSKELEDLITDFLVFADDGICPETRLTFYERDLARIREIEATYNPPEDKVKELCVLFRRSTSWHKCEQCER